MGDDGTNVHIPKPDVNRDSIMTTVTNFIVAHPVPVAAGVLAIAATIFYRKNKVLSIGLICLGVGIVATRMYMSTH